ncbi:hypothetical protein [Chitinophaga japonensis]|uniref:Uncharacterized protein n=1 Tax=Chitinophaga japonensis TaxID=104662 RepID=A0A562SJK6_CHIJA|nr:hypothetical protein [Chitinophaga japonensis]TWI80980.1 hypothetical protein LX66_5585 [Chitinophaga japonensis]
MNYSASLFYLAIGLIIIILIDTVGAITSRRFSFDYRYLGILSLALYAVIGYFASREAGVVPAIVINGLLGCFDGTAGFWLSIRLKANNGLNAKESTKLLGVKTAMSMTAIAIAFGLAGYGLSFILT